MKSTLELDIESLAKATNGKRKTSKGPFAAIAEFPFSVHGKYKYLKWECLIGNSMALLEINNIAGICPFEISIHQPWDFFGLILKTEISAAVGSPFRVYGHSHQLDWQCIKKTFGNWKSWKTLLDKTSSLNSPIFICNRQCMISMNPSALPQLNVIINDLFEHLTEGKFVKLLKNE